MDLCKLKTPEGSVVYVDKTKVSSVTHNEQWRQLSIVVDGLHYDLEYVSSVELVIGWCESVVEDSFVA